MGGMHCRTMCQLMQSAAGSSSREVGGRRGSSSLHHTDPPTDFVVHGSPSQWDRDPTRKPRLHACQASCMHALLPYSQAGCLPTKEGHSLLAHEGHLTGCASAGSSSLPSYAKEAARYGIIGIHGAVGDQMEPRLWMMWLTLMPHTVSQSFYFSSISKGSESSQLIVLPPSIRKVHCSHPVHGLVNPSSFHVTYRVHYMLQPWCTSSMVA